MMRFTLSPVPPRLCPDLRLPHTSVTAASHFSSSSLKTNSSPSQLELGVLPGPLKDHIVPSTPPYSSASFLHICIVVCSHNDRIHGNAEPVVLNNNGGWMRGRASRMISHVWTRSSSSRSSSTGGHKHFCLWAAAWLPGRVLYLPSFAAVTGMLL